MAELPEEEVVDPVVAVSLFFDESAFLAGSDFFDDADDRESVE